ncbi:MAG: hypothetical protein JXB49_23165 [Bacteroidales bacterium]|nr:hypothetical protein [Bacteroidales bacterium]
MKDYIPLIQTILWIFFSVGIIIFLRKEIQLILHIINQRLHSGSEFKIGPIEIGELKTKIDTVEKELTNVSENVSKLFLITMAEPMFYNLEKIGSGKFGKYEFSKGLERELYHLRDIGYIDIKSIQSIPKEGENLSQYVKITEAGRTFVQFRKEFIDKNK